MTYSFEVTRFAQNPLMTPESSPIVGDNINGPSVIRAPEWLRGAPGHYLMYFSHHRDTFIRLAAADRPEGPWKVHDTGCLTLEQVSGHGFTGHIASPDVHLDE